MQRRNRNRQNGRHHSAVAGALCIAVVVVAAGCATVHSGSPMPSPMPSTPGVSIATIPGTSATGSPSQGLGITAPPGSAPPLAASLPLVNSCNPRSVPRAIAVAAPAAGKAGSFVLHVPILMYHRIVPSAEAGNSLSRLVVPPAIFAAQLDALKLAGWHTITLGTLANDLQARVKPAQRTFVITIDDGWDDGYTYALPILAQHGFVATYFVIAGRIDRPGFLTSTHLQAIVAAGDEIGDHTMDHVHLPTQPAAKLPYEIDAAAARIAQVTGHWPESFAYPYGSVNSRVVIAVAACQELRIAVIEESVALETWTNRFVVPRIHVGPDATPARLVAELGLLGAG
jgi:peptidoglycan/xylan/chitin deacetylase (PgdA/CDA1 family)